MALFDQSDICFPPPILISIPSLLHIATKVILKKNKSDVLPLPSSSYAPHFPFQSSLYQPPLFCSMPHHPDLSPWITLLSPYLPGTALSLSLASPSGFLFNLRPSAFLYKVSDFPGTGQESLIYVCATRESNGSLSSCTIWKAYLTVFCQRTVNT